ncbi:MAG: Do family serine endopeptidase [Hyphomicrobiaceae bacterium]|nr:MAG: Do family serine endopeptidase [Hyphomicrobiaceae bacterium]KAB2851843.1 MAG: Do family serine endopeptidase [Hyphomicrobiaceae bacterium]
MDVVIRAPMRSCRALALRAGLGLMALGMMLAPVQAQVRGPASVAPVAEKLIDAVVNISTSQTLKGPEGVPLPRVPKGAPFEEFFEDFFNRKNNRSPSERKVSSLGSGFVIDGKEGLIVTNNHVIDGADEIIINFHDGSKLKVDKVLGKDTKTDLALLKVTPKRPLPAVSFGASAKLRVGDWVMAIGNPFGLGGSVTVGIISAKQRDINSGPYDDFLQTDAAINKGNSGGPLFNMDGEVIGVNTAIISPTGGSIGIGFAVPSDTAVVVIDQLRQFGETRRGWLGVKIQSLTEDIAEAYGVKENTGALVASVTPDSPAAKAGIVDGDVILKFDGKDVTTMRGLPRLVAQTPIGKDVDIEVLRKGQKKNLKVAVGRLTEDEEQAKPTAKDAPKGKGRSKGSDKDGSKPTGQALIGLVLAPLTDELRTKHGLAKTVAGVIVLQVDPASPAAEKGVKVGDVIVEIAQQPVSSVEDVTKGVDRVRKAGGKAVLLRLEGSKGDVRFVAVPLR